MFSLLFKNTKKVPYPKAVSIVADFIGYDLSSYQDKNIVVDEKKNIYTT